MFKPGDKARYIGTGFPEYTGKMLEIDRAGETTIILLKPEEDRKTVTIEVEPGQYNTWKSEVILCDIDEIEMEET